VHLLVFMHILMKCTVQEAKSISCVWRCVYSFHSLYSQMLYPEYRRLWLSCNQKLNNVISCHVIKCSLSQGTTPWRHARRVDVHLLLSCSRYPLYKKTKIPSSCLVLNPSHLAHIKLLHWLQYSSWTLPSSANLSLLSDVKHTCV
jgi:hypothetical protein